MKKKSIRIREKTGDEHRKGEIDEDMVKKTETLKQTLGKESKLKENTREQKRKQ